MTATQSRIALHPASAGIGNNIVSIASGKGGVGKTWLAATLAQALARTSRVLLFDGDLGLANIDIQLGLNVRHDLGGVVAGRIAMADAVTVFKEGGFDIIAGKSGTGTLADLSRDTIRGLQNELWMLARSYDHVIIDLGAGVETAIRALVPRGGTTLVVVTDEPTSLTDAYAFIKLTLQANPKADLRVVVNMVRDVKTGERTYATIAKACINFLKTKPPLAGIVPRDGRVPDAIRHQTALLIRHPMSDAAKAVEAIAKGLHERMAGNA